MSHVEFIDQTLREGNQSLWGMRMRAFEAAPALPYLNRTGFKVIDLTGGTMFTVLMRAFRDDPWATTDFLVAGLSESTVRAGNRTMSIGGMSFMPDSIIDLWVRTLIRHGVGSFWFFDCLYGMDRMRRLVEVTANEGAESLPAIMYGLTDVHTDQFFADRAAEMASWPAVKAIYIEDAPGVLTVERASTLLPAIRAVTPGIRLELHCHTSTGQAPLVYLEGVKHGIDALHTASSPMANGPSLPSTEATVANLVALGHTHRIDITQLPPVAEHFERLAIAGGYPVGTPNEFSVLPYEHQLPGGMTGTLKSQLAQHGMENRFDEVLQEIPRVRQELGQPIMATPFSQFVGIQSLLNIVTGDRYSIVPDETVQYALGHYGKLMRKIDPEVEDRILSSPRAQQFEGWEQPQPSLKKVRQHYGPNLSDEELLLRALYSTEDVDATLAAGPIRTDPLQSSSTIVEHLAEVLAEANHLKRLKVSVPGMSISLRRRAVTVHD